MVLLLLALTLLVCIYYVRKSKKMSKRITAYKLNRLTELIAGEDEPLDYAEQLFIESYKSAFHGESLMSLFVNIIGDTKNVSTLELECFILGYAMGQKQGDDLFEAHAKSTDDNDYH